jgi:Na+/proline symporter
VNASRGSNGPVPRIAFTLGPSCIVPIAMVCAVTCVVSIVVAFTFVMGIGRGTRATSKRQGVVIVVAITLVPIAVACVHLVAVVAWIEVHDTSAESERSVHRERCRTQADVA